MPADVAEDSLDLAIELLEAVEPSPESYPFPQLRRLHRSERRTFRSIVLENQHFRATVVPDLGGRIVRWEDKRANSDLWEFGQELAVADGGRRGVELGLGLQIRTGFADRLNSMGAVANVPDYAEDDETPSGVWLGEVCGDGISLNWRLAAPDGKPYLLLEVRAFNRSLRPVPYNGGIGVGGGSYRKSGNLWLWATEEGSLVFECPYLTYAEQKGLYRFNRTRYLAPRQLDSWTARIYPSGVGARIRAANTFVHVGWDRQEMRVQGLEAVDGKAVVLTGAGQTLEMPLELSRSMISRIPLDGMKDEIVEFVLLDGERREVIRATTSGESQAPERCQDEPLPTSLDVDSNEDALREAEFDVSLRGLAHVLTGNLRLGGGDYAGASQAFEQALLFNAEDHLAWWAKAAAERNGGAEGDELPELLNAHFLAPLEPVLRAEGFLASATASREKSSVLNILEDTPETFVDIACLLLEANLLHDAAKWLGEALLHVDLPMLRYLLASVYLQLGGMEVDAAEQVQLAVRENPEPPFPYRSEELKALKRVLDRFPQAGSLGRMVEHWERSQPPQ